MDVKRTERGWAGHFICADKCRFRRNTLIEYGDKKWVVSSVGALYLFNPLTNKVELDSVGYERWYETMAFVARDDEYNDADMYRRKSILKASGDYLEQIKTTFLKITRWQIWKQTKCMRRLLKNLCRRLRKVIR